MVVSVEDFAADRGRHILHDSTFDSEETQMTVDGVDEELLIQATAAMNGKLDHLKPITPKEREAAMENPAETINDALNFVVSRWY